MRPNDTADTFAKRALTERIVVHHPLHRSLRVGAALLVATLATAVVAQSPVPSGTVITIAGNGGAGFSGDDGPAIDATLHGPLGSAIGPDGAAYFVDEGNYRIRRLDPVTGNITTIAGVGPGSFSDGPNGDGGPATSAQIADPITLAIDRERNTLYFPSLSLSRVRQIDLATGIVDSFAGTGVFDPFPPGQYGDGGPATSAWFLSPYGVAVGTDHDVLITDIGLNTLRSVDGTTGIVSRLAGQEFQFLTSGDGAPASSASFTVPDNVVTDSAGNIYIEDSQFDNSFLVRRIDAATGIIDTVAGGGTLTPGSGLATDTLLTEGGGTGPIAIGGDALYIGTGNRVLAVDLTTGQLNVLAGQATAGFSGDGGPAADAEFSGISGLTLVPGGGLLVSDGLNNRVRYIAPDSINLTGDAGQTEFHLPWVSALSGDVTISDTAATIIDVGSLASVGGGVTISDNTAATTIDVSSLTFVGDNVTIVSNSAAMEIDVGLLTTVGGDVTISDNTAATIIDISSLTSAGGDVTLDTTGSGIFDLSSAAVGGDTSLTTDGYDEVDAMTAAGQTAVTMVNGAATMELVLPDGAFALDDHVPFSVKELPADPIDNWGQDPMTTLAQYQFDFAITTLDQDATLNFEIDLTALEPDAQQALLDLLHTNTLLTLAVQGDDPDAELQTFDVCGAGADPSSGCVAVRWLDENSADLEPYGAVDPAAVHFESLVGHFSTYSIVAVKSVPEPASLVLLIMASAMILVPWPWCDSGDAPSRGLHLNPSYLLARYAY